MVKQPIGIENLTPARNRIKELAGIPTYIGSALVAIKYTNNNFLIGTAVFLCFIAIYYYVYQLLFPAFDTASRKNKLTLFIVIQVIFWFCIIAFL